MAHTMLMRHLPLAASIAVAASVLPGIEREVRAPTHEATADLGGVSDPFICPICGGSMDDFEALLALLYRLNGRVTIEVVSGGALGFLVLR